MKKFLFVFGRILSILGGYKFLHIIDSIRNHVFTGIVSKRLKYAGNNVYIKHDVIFNDLKYIEIDDNSTIESRCSITAWHKRGNQIFLPKLHIGKNVSIGTDCHITCINGITISDGCLIGKMVTISDNNHFADNHDLSGMPINRNVSSKGTIIIKENVWIADKVSILGNVIIGEGAVIGSNAVVTKSVPPYSVVVGNPAKVIIQN